MICVVVYLGQKIPRYVIMNCLYMQGMFPEEDFVLITDSDVEKQKARDIGLNVWLCDPQLLKNSFASQSKMLDREFRNGFWIYTTTRFQAIAEFAKNYPDESILQIEADVLLMPNFPFKEMKGIQSNFAFPISQENVGIASVFFYRNLQATRLFSDFVNQSFVDKPDTNDCEILGNLARLDPENVLVLPANLPSRDCFNKSASEDLFAVMTTNSNMFDGIFDGASWGQFLSGHDPRNSLGIRCYFKNRLHQATNCSIATLSTDRNGAISAKYKSIQKSIYCLHIHSKDEKFFVDGNFIHLHNLVDKLPRKPMYAFSAKVFLHSLPYFFKKRNIKYIQEKLFQKSIGFLKKVIR